MNSSVIARPCWSVLANKAEEKISSLQVEMAQARQRLESLESSRLRVQAMYEDYRLKLNDPQGESQGMREAMNQRQFMAQLLTLMQRVTTDMQHTQNLLDSYKERLLEAERERIKMQTLANQNALAVQNNLNRKEQKQMDSLGVMQFNLKPQT
jgi:flagellar export protein FliJ